MLLGFSQGFSQGGCLALEYAARHACRYGAVIGLSAGLIGPQNTQRAYAGVERRAILTPSIFHAD